MFHFRDFIRKTEQMEHYKKGHGRVPFFAQIEQIGHYKGVSNV